MMDPRRQGLSMETVDAAGLSPAVLAYLGDGVFELFVREWLVAREGVRTTGALHRRATRLVCASAQARMARSLADRLTPEERDVLRRGRNAHGGRAPAGADVAEYRLATGFESLVGFLHLTGRTGRLEELLAAALAALTEGEDG